MFCSKTAYERQVKRWGFRKNLKQNETKMIMKKLANRARQQNKLDVYVGGNLMPASAITSKISRLYVPASEQYAGPRMLRSRISKDIMSLMILLVQRCTTPEGIVIIPHASDLYLRYVKTKDIPWIYFMKQISSFGTYNAFSLFLSIS